jgi:hypothetical protein
MLLICLSAPAAFAYAAPTIECRPTMNGADQGEAWSYYSNGTCFVGNENNYTAREIRNGSETIIECISSNPNGYFASAFRIATAPNAPAKLQLVGTDGQWQDASDRNVNYICK